MPTAFDPIDVSGSALQNRIVMAALTRRRAYGPGLSATPLMADYYEQRASAGLIIGEAMQPCPGGQGYTCTPGMHTDAQVASWRPITERVRAAGGTIFGQLQHAGRMTHPDLLGSGLRPLAPSAVAADGVVRVNVTEPAIRRSYPEPDTMSDSQIRRSIVEFADAAENCMRAGFDGVEIHGAYTYLVQQFLSSNANLRRDGWGTSIDGRVRYPLELVNAVASRIGPEKLALRISPGCTHHGIEEDDLDEVYLALVDGLPTRLAFLDVFEFPGHRALTRRIRERWTGVLVLNPHETADEWPAGPQQLDVIDRGLADMIAFGTHFIANPDLVQRLRVGAPLTPADEATFYMGDHRGYTDYPTRPVTSASGSASVPAQA